MCCCMYLKRRIWSYLVRRWKEINWYDWEALCACTSQYWHYTKKYENRIKWHFLLRIKLHKDKKNENWNFCYLKKFYLKFSATWLFMKNLKIHQKKNKSRYEKWKMYLNVMKTTKKLFKKNNKNYYRRKSFLRGGIKSTKNLIWYLMIFTRQKKMKRLKKFIINRRMIMSRFFLHKYSNRL